MSKALVLSNHRLIPDLFQLSEAILAGIVARLRSVYARFGRYQQPMRPSYALAIGVVDGVIYEYRKLLGPTGVPPYLG